MSSLVPETSFAQGASVTGNVYDTSPAGLGLSPAYLASSSASASSSTTTSGTIFPTSPVDGNIFVYTADAANGIKWAFIYDSSQATYKWLFIGGPPMSVDTAASQTTTSTAYADLATVGSIIVPRAGDYDVWGGCLINNGANTTYVSPKLGSATASDADARSHVGTDEAGGLPPTRATSLAASDVIKLQFRAISGTGTFANRRLRVRPVRVI